MKKIYIVILMILLINIVNNVNNVKASDEQDIFYMNDNDGKNLWANNPEFMNDGNPDTYAYTASTDQQILNSSNILNNDRWVINDVNFRLKGYKANSNNAYIRIRPVYLSGNGDVYDFYVTTTPSYSNWQNMNDDANAPSWDYYNLSNMYFDVRSSVSTNIIYCSIVELRINYTIINNAPIIYDPSPVDTGIFYMTYNCSSLQYSRDNTNIMLCAKFNDSDGDLMNITYTFEKGTGSTLYQVPNGTYCFNISKEFPDDIITFEVMNNWGFLATDGIDLTAESFKFKARVNNQCCDLCPPSGNSYNFTGLDIIIYNNTKIEGSYVNLSFDIYIQNGTFNYTIECNNSQSKYENNVNNGTFYILLENIEIYENYSIWVNVTDNMHMINTDFNMVLLTSDINIIFDTSQLGLIITCLLFCFFLFIGYNSPKRSGGGFMLLSAFMLFALEGLLTGFIDPLLILPLISPIAVFILLLGIRKQFYPLSDENPKSEAMGN